jgi:hypothetical protein
MNIAELITTTTVAFSVVSSVLVVATGLVFYFHSRRSRNTKQYHDQLKHQD